LATGNPAVLVVSSYCHYGTFGMEHRLQSTGIWYQVPVDIGFLTKESIHIKDLAELMHVIAFFIVKVQRIESIDVTTH
jgi:hypothetical protein